jgi:hypothetical protein
MPGLHSPADFQRLGDEAAAVVARLSQMAISGNLEGMQFLEAFDEISDSLCLVLDTAELCRSVHPDPVNTHLRFNQNHRIATTHEKMCPVHK